MSSSCSDQTNNDNHNDDVDIRYMGKNIQLSSGLVLTSGTDLPNILIPAQTLPIDIKVAMAIALIDIETPTKGRRDPRNAKDER